MTAAEPDARRDLVVLVADSDIEQTARRLLARPTALGIAPIEFDVLKHPMRDNGCRTASHDLLRSQARRYRFALVVFDLEGSGGERDGRAEVEAKVERNLASNGWPDRGAAVAIDPEVEIWMWIDDVELHPVVGWPAGRASARDWLRSRGDSVADNGKPLRPKEALRSVLRHTGRPPSASLFGQVATSASLTRCTDLAFAKVRDTLRRWFPA